MKEGALQGPRTPIHKPMLTWNTGKGCNDPSHGTWDNIEEPEVDFQRDKVRDGTIAVLLDLVLLVYISFPSEFVLWLQLGPCIL